MPKCKIPPERYDEVFEAWQNGLTQREIARRLGVSESTISYVMRKRRERKDYHRGTETQR